MCCADGFVHERIVDAQHVCSSNANIDFLLKPNLRCPRPERTSSGAKQNFHLLLNDKNRWRRLIILTSTVRNKSGKHRGSSPVFPRWGITYLINLSPRTFITYVFPRSFPTKYITKLRMKYQSDVISLYLIFRSPVFPRCFPAPYNMIKYMVMMR